MRQSTLQYSFRMLSFNKRMFHIPRKAGGFAPPRAAGLLSKDKVLSLLATSLLNRNPYGFPINGSPVF